MSANPNHQPVRVLIQHGRFTAGRFTDGPFKGQRAISNDGGRVFLPAGKGEPEGFGKIFGDIFKSVMPGAQGGAA